LGFCKEILDGSAKVGWNVREATVDCDLAPALPALMPEATDALADIDGEPLDCSLDIPDAEVLDRDDCDRRERPDCDLGPLTESRI